MANDGTLIFDTSIDASGINTGLKKIESIASASLKTTAAILTGAATAISGLGAAAIKVGSDFESQMDKVAAISGATEKEFQQLCDIAKEMGATTKFTATEAGQGLEYMAMAGWDAEDSIAALPAVLNLAAAAGEDLGTTSDIVTDAMTAFKMEAGEAAHFADVLAATATSANTNVSMMGDTFKYVAPVAGTLGYNIEDTSVAIGLMANSGIKASIAGTSLRSILTRLSTDAGATANSLGALGTLTGILGVEFYNADGSARDFNKVLSESREAWRGLTEEEQLNYAKTIAGQEGISGWMALMNASQEDVDELANSIENCNGAAEEMAAIMQDNLSGQITILQSALEGLGISVYESMQEPLKETAIMAQEWVSQLHDAFKNGGFSSLVSEAGDVIAQIAQKITEYGPTLINAAVGLISSFKNSLFENREEISSAGAELIASLVEGIASAHEDIMITIIAIGADILGKIAESAPKIVSAVVTAVTDITETLANYSPDILQAGADIILAIASGIVDALPTLANHASLILTDICNVLVQNIPALVDVALQIVQALAQGLIEALPLLLEGATTLFMSIVEALPVVIEQLVTALPEIITTIVDFLASSLPQIVDAALTMLFGLIDAIPDIIEVLVENLPDIIIAIVGALIDAAPQIFDAAVAMFFGLVDAIHQSSGDLVEAIPEIVMAIVETIVGLGYMLVDVGSNIIDWLVEGASSVWGNITEWFAEAIPNLISSIMTFFEELPYKIGYAIGNTIGTLVDWNNSVNEWIATEIPKIIDNIIEWFKELPDRIAEWFNQTVDNLMQWGADFKESSVEKVDEICIGIAEGFKELPSKLVEIGENLIDGLIEGIAGKAQDLWNSVKGFCGGIIDGFKDALGIHSPSTVMEEQAGYLVDGVVNGIADMPARALEAMSGVATEVIAWGAELASAGLNAATEFANAVISTVQMMPTQVTTWLTDVVARITVWAVNLKTAAIAAATGLVNGIITQISQLPTKIWTWLINVINKITVWRTNLIEKGRAAAEGLCTAVINGVKGLPDKMTEIGSNIVSGIWNGISSGWSWLADNVKGLANNILKTAKDALGINSPSRVFMMEVGKWIPPGISSGISMTMPSAISDLEDEMGLLVAKAQASLVFDTVKTATPIVDSANARAEKAGTVINHYDYSTNIDNDFNVPVVSAAEINRAQRQTERKIYGGVK